MPTKELDSLNAKLNKLKAERSALIKKTTTISGMITGLEKRSRDVPDTLRASLARKEKHVKELNGKISRSKAHIACVETRDYVAALNIGRLKDNKICCRGADTLCYNNGVRFSCGKRAVPVRHCSHALRRAGIRL